MLSAILGAIFLKEMPDRKTWISIIITFIAIIYIFFDSIKLGNFYGDILGFITALGLAVGAVTIRSAKVKIWFLLQLLVNYLLLLLRCFLLKVLS